MAKSIVQKEKVCLVCHTTQNLELHHCLPGARRRIADELGLTVYLCHEHHTGAHGVHFDKQFMLELKQLAQTVFVEQYGEKVWFERVGKNYLTDTEGSFEDE